MPRCLCDIQWEIKLRYQLKVFSVQLVFAKHLYSLKTCTFANLFVLYCIGNYPYFSLILNYKVLFCRNVTRDTGTCTQKQTFWPTDQGPLGSRL